MKNANVDLASVFVQIEKRALGLEGVAGGIFSVVKQFKITTLDGFNDRVSEAFAKNGWSQGAGRPVGGVKRSAPDAVRIYVSTFRAAFRMKLDVMSFDSMHGMRKAIKEKRASSVRTVERPPELVGVQVSSENSLTGALWHDAVVLWEHLPSGEKQEFEKQVRKLLHKFAKSAPPELAHAA